MRITYVLLSLLLSSCYFKAKVTELSSHERILNNNTPNSDSNAAPVAILSGVPGSISNSLNLNVVVSGSNVSTYKYKVGPSLTTFCNVDIGYISDVPVSLHILDDLSSFSDGPMTLCVLGKDESGTEQSLTLASEANWIKDTSQPTVTNVFTTNADGFYKVGAQIDINIVFTKPVIVTGGIPVLQLNSSATSQANYISGSLSNTLVFRYSVGASDMSSNLNYSSINSLSLNGATLGDSIGNLASLTLPALNGGDDLGSVNHLIIDTMAPTSPSSLNVGAVWSTTTTETPVLTFTSGSDSLSGLAGDEVKVYDVTAANDVNSFTSFTSGNSISGLSLTDGHNYKFILRSRDRASNNSVEVSSNIWTVDITPPSAPGVISIGSISLPPPLNYFKKSTPNFIFINSTDNSSGLSSYLIEIHKQSDNSVVKSYVTATGDGSGLSYSQSNEFLTSGETYYANIKAMDRAGNVGLATQSPTWVALICPTNYAIVPAQSPYTTQAFCLSQFEMKLQYNGSIVADGNFSNSFNYSSDYADPGVKAKYVPISDPSGRPWVNILRGSPETGPGAIEACQSLGSQYSLMTNSEWQSVAQNAENVAINWTSGVVGSETMYRGHSDGIPNTTLSVMDTNDYYDQTGNNSGQGWGVGKEQRRTMVLSNGAIIWDLAGNVWEWVKDNNISGDFGLDDFISQINNSNHPIVGTVGNDTGTAKSFFGSLGNYSFAVSHYGGFGYAYINTTSTFGGIIRGGSWGNGPRAGVFATFLTLPPTQVHFDLGFRCSYK